MPELVSTAVATARTGRSRTSLRYGVLSAVARCPAWDSAARSAHTVSPTAPPAPSLPRTLPAASSSCTARIPSSSPVSSARGTSSCWHDFIYTPCGKGGLNQSLPRIFGVLHTEDNACLERIPLFKQFFDALRVRGSIAKQALITTGLSCRRRIRL